MIGNRLEQSIILVFQDDISSTFSINEVSKRLKKSYPTINKKSNFFIKEGVLRKINIGRSYQCFLNMHNDKTKILMTINEVNKKELLIQKTENFAHVMDEIQQITKKFKMDSIILYKKSILFITSEQNKKEEILQLSVLTKDYNLLFFDKKSFQTYFLSNKDIWKYHFILYNTENYLNIIEEISDELLVKNLMRDKEEKS